MNYARQASSSLFVGPGLRDDWRDYLDAASCVESEFERCTRDIRAAQVLFESEGMFGHPPSRREAGQSVTGTLAAGAHPGSYNGRDAERNMLIPFDLAQITSAVNRTTVADGGPAWPLNTSSQMHVAYNISGGHKRADRPAGGTVERFSSGVRRLMPVECERLQGFPDGWTDGQADSARYRQLGNAVAVPVIEWIGRRIIMANNT